MFTISKEIQDIESTDTPGDSNKNARIFFYPKENPTAGVLLWAVFPISK